MERDPPPHYKHHHHQHHRGNSSASERRFHRNSLQLRASFESLGVKNFFSGLSVSRAAELSILSLATFMCITLWYCTRRKQAKSEHPLQDAGTDTPRDLTPRQERAYQQVRNSYLCVYALATFGDWIQGGYLYALYAEYGYTMREVGLIFVIGYLSAATLGTYVSALSDICGHRRNCILYGFIYAISCFLCNTGGPIPLACGRVIGGVAYSILYTSFESWLISEADARELPLHALARLFSVATFTNAASAVAAGFIGHLTVEVLRLPNVGNAANKYARAFNVAVVVLLMSSAVACSMWDERHGSQRRSASDSLLHSWRAIRQSKSLLALGLVNSLFEAALYVFVFMWTPALERRSDGQVGHGLVFSIFMLSKMAGSQAFTLLERRLHIATALQVVFMGSAICLAVPLVSDSYTAALFAFSGFEALLGIYWPSIAMLRTLALDDSQRASTMAVFRLLLNLLVAIALPLAGGCPERAAFVLCIVMQALCLCCILLVGGNGVALSRKPSNRSDSVADLSETAKMLPSTGVAKLLGNACSSVMDTIHSATRGHQGGKYHPVEALSVPLSEMSASPLRHSVPSPSSPMVGGHSAYSAPPSPHSNDALPRSRHCTSHSIAPRVSNQPGAVASRSRGATASSS